MEMAWGIIMTGFTLFGMLVLLVASVRMENRRDNPTMGEGKGPAWSPHLLDRSASPRSDIKKAA